MKKIISVLDKFHSGVSYNAIGCEFIINQYYVLKGVFKQKHMVKLDYVLISYQKYFDQRLTGN